MSDDEQREAERRDLIIAIGATDLRQLPDLAAIKKAP